MTGSTWGAVVAGTVWGFWPYHFAHLIHLQLQALYAMPLTFLFLHRLVAGRRRWDALGLGVTVGLQASTSVYYGVIGGGRPDRLDDPRSRRGVGGRRVGLLFAACCSPASSALIARRARARAVLQAQQREGFGRNLFEASRHAASLVELRQRSARERALRRRRA